MNPALVLRHPAIRLLGRMLTQYALVFLIAATLNFVLPRAMPGSPLRYLAGEDVGRLTAVERERVVRQAGLDRPPLEQYVTYLAGLVRGNLGYSFQQKRPVVEVLLDRMPWTLLLTGTALMLSTTVGVAAGAVAAWRRGQAWDVGAFGVFVLLESLPGFWVGMILVALFGVQLGLFPTFGARDTFARLQGAAYWLDVVHHLVLPLSTLVIVTTSANFLTMRASMLSVLGEDYVTVARGKGLSGRQVLFRHAVRNALLPVATVFLLNLGYAIAGATVIETVFAYPGVGRTMYEAALGRDYPLLQGGFLLITVSIVFANLFADLAYPLLDPRVTTRTAHWDGRAEHS